MEKTTNYQLNKPEPTDPLRVADFNENADIIDAALGEVSAERVYVGSYVGDGTASRTIELPFEPKFAILFGQIHSYKRIVFLTEGQDFYTISDGWSSSSEYNTQLLGNSFVIKSNSFNNHKDVIFHYILFR